MTTIHAFGRHIATYLGTDLHKAAVGESKWKDQEHFEQSLNISSTQRSIVITPSYCELDIVRMVVDMMRGDKTELFDIENEGSDYPYCIKHIAMWAANHLTIGDTDRSDIDAGTVDQIISWFLAFGNNAEKLRQVVQQTEAVHHAIEQIQWFSTYDKTILWTLVKSISAFGHQILEKITSQCAVWDEMMLHLRPDSLPKNLSHFVSRKYGGYPTDISLLQLYKDCLPYVNLVNISSSLSVFVMHMVQLFVSPKKHVPDHSDERTIEYSQQLILYGLTFHYISSLERICDGLHGLQEIELLYTDTVEGLVQAAIETSCDTTVPLPLLSPTAAGTAESALDRVIRWSQRTTFFFSNDPKNNLPRTACTASVLRLMSLLTNVSKPTMALLRHLHKQQMRQKLVLNNVKLFVKSASDPTSYRDFSKFFADSVSSVHELARRFPADTVPPAPPTVDPTVAEALLRYVFNDPSLIASTPVSESEASTAPPLPSSETTPTLSMVLLNRVAHMAHRLHYAAWRPMTDMINRYRSDAVQAMYTHYRVDAFYRSIVHGVFLTAETDIWQPISEFLRDRVPQAISSSQRDGSFSQRNIQRQLHLLHDAFRDNVVQVHHRLTALAETLSQQCECVVSLSLAVPPLATDTWDSSWEAQQPSSLLEGWTLVLNHVLLHWIYALRIEMHLGYPLQDLWTVLWQRYSSAQAKSSSNTEALNTCLSTCLALRCVNTVLDTCWMNLSSEKGHVSAHSIHRLSALRLAMTLHHKSTLFYLFSLLSNPSTVHNGSPSTAQTNLWKAPDNIEDLAFAMHKEIETWSLVVRGIKERQERAWTVAWTFGLLSVPFESTMDWSVYEVAVEQLQSISP